MIECRSFPAMVEAADAMVKAAKVELVSYEKTGGGYTTAVVRGDVAAVRAACDAGPARRRSNGGPQGTAVKLAKVLGTVVATEKDDKLGGLRFLMLGDWGHDNKASGGSVVAVDAVGAGVGEMVLYASGSSARQTERTDKKPVDAVVMAIVDSWEIEGDEIYRKGETDA
jgi:microcompartment protein CcmK/EutM